MQWAQDHYKENVDSERLPAPVFAARDNVWVKMTNIPTKRPLCKLDWKYIGPYPILRKISSHAYEVDLPESIHIHLVFHISLL
jgi:hypothetical protein